MIDSCLKEQIMQRRVKSIEVRLTVEERSFIDEQAAATGLTISDFIRKRSLGKRIVSKADLQLINDIRRLGGLQKHLAAIYPEQKLEFGRVLNEIILFLRRVQ